MHRSQPPNKYWPVPYEWWGSPGDWCLQIKQTINTPLDVLADHTLYCYTKQLRSEVIIWPSFWTLRHIRVQGRFRMITSVLSVTPYFKWFFKYNFNICYPNSHVHNYVAVYPRLQLIYHNLFDTSEFALCVVMLWIEGVTP